MDWVKLLTEFENGPKALAAGLDGCGLYARALAYCGKYETDGHVPAAWVKQATAAEDKKALASHLLEVGLWVSTDSGFFIADFTEVNKSKAEYQALKKSRSGAGKKGGKARAKANAKQKGGKSPSHSSSSSSSSFEVPQRFQVVCQQLDHVAHHRNLAPPHPEKVVEVCERWADRDHTYQAERFARWFTTGKGQNSRMPDVVERFFDWLETSPPAGTADSAPPPPRRVDPRSTVASDLAELEREHARLVAEEAAA